MRRRRAAGRGVLPLLAALVLAAPALAEPACAPGRVDIRWDGGGESFAVEVADDTAERAQGLMFRESLDPGAGMLFVYDAPRRVSFWMKNTLIPLDMVFADEVGRVTAVHSMAQPLDETPIDGGEGVQFVLEINGGLADRLGIAPGAELRHPSIRPGAVWPCD